MRTRVTIVRSFVCVCVSVSWFVCVPKSDSLTWKSTLFMFDIDGLHITHKQMLLSRDLIRKHRWREKAGKSFTIDIID